MLDSIPDAAADLLAAASARSRDYLPNGRPVDAILSLEFIGRVFDHVPRDRSNRRADTAS
ncbi:hypothetical protein ABZ829_02720 [Streptomyces xanthochromogenes]|uniref:hypothetical protein n=1 Tax=Streptomyces TaxID=1883 RepID=UPI0013722E2F|nr:hypothetical protein [Streptomyces sp. SID1034]MYV90222.1 hypothetical protein [Streptomyces sp. SID1034]